MSKNILKNQNKNKNKSFSKLLRNKRKYLSKRTPHKFKTLKLLKMNLKRSISNCKWKLNSKEIEFLNLKKNLENLKKRWKHKLKLKKKTSNDLFKK